jgi:16S rRNA (adenine1518-N6/adenine1519-N6)-dimethyltransferase
VVEIGPGKGALTAHLLERADHVIAIEIDPILVQYLRAKFRGNERLELIEADVLKVDLGQWGPAAVAGNLPYYITSPILTKVLALGEGMLRAVFLVQKEVADRLTAVPGSRDYGYLTVATQYQADVEYLFTVPPAAFHPAPKVDSSVVRLTSRRERPAVDPAAFLRFVSLAFRHKRKTLRNNLLEQYDRAVLDALPEGKLRAEEMSIEALLDLYRRLHRAT